MVEKELTFVTKGGNHKFTGVEMFRMFEIDKEPKIAFIVYNPRAISKERVFDIDGLTTVVNTLTGSTMIYCASITETKESCKG